ncbi:hypothetical protein SAMN05421829_11929 [Aromatoleum tolulyticum]|uniref:Uncharacterized protein n=1 Tax=Aromatoleum tolulyticum TaxID=34027 RepID=A0A1N7BRY1_9RHOO|nr:hypothetical protein [Aromatoleum tolulyticum]SIR54003.1 hypothetical protein SAMN05421829_11929 [Aromatoleum tolulyticum]
MNVADLHIGRVVLRGTASAIDHARATLPAALARTHWPADEAIVVVRRLTVGGTASELPARAAAAAEHLTRRAADPWSPAADAAEAVRFRDALDYRACLVRDLLSGTAARRWLWRHRASLLARPAAQALADLFAEDALALPALLERPALRDSLPALWRTLDAPTARTLLHAIATATGWQTAITSALDPTHERRAEKRSAFRRMDGDGFGEASLGSSPVHAVAHWASSAFGSSALRFVLPIDLPPSDPRVVLQAVLALWTHAPATLAASTAGEILRATAETFVPAAPSDEPETKDPREPDIATADASGKAGEPAADPTQAGPPEIPVPAKDASHAATPPDHAANAAARSTPEGDTPDKSPTRAPSTPSQVSSAAASPAALPSAAEHDFHTRGGGFFFLLNVLNLPALRDWRATLVEPQAGWRELVRLARSLDFYPDAPLATFLAAACDLATDGDPAAALAALPAGTDLAPVCDAAFRHYGAAALAAALADRSARIRATRSHLDVHLRLSDVHRDVHLDIRRTGLDLDPGWLPWLGRVVRFHYDSGGFSS